ncbi:hypothetical protein WMY93_006681 [Mugilogobius chulae]|uniref:ZP domain-containing protein n=1 Tax=Mugilogobius chulae TaxID=88201 RepID=A0AAW0PPC1_9GOBI
MSKLARKLSPAPLPKIFRANPGFKMLPDFVVVSSATDQKALFKPERGARPLPNIVQPLLFPTTTVAPTEPTEPRIVEVLCHIDRMYVRIRRDAFKTVDAYKYLKLGTCPVNQGTLTHFYFLYLLTSDCHFSNESNVDHLTIKNVLHYLPTTPVLREIPFDVPVKCNYQRLHHSYKVGFRPNVLGGTFFKSLRRKLPILLFPQDGKPYDMGGIIVFVAKLPDGTPTSADDRLYINKCFVTPSIIPSSTPKYTVIDNYGCMVESKESADVGFFRGPSRTTVQFRISAAILRELASSSSTTQLYMHCHVSLGKRPASEGFKACNYDRATRRWRELDGDDSVCTCCDSSCQPVGPELLGR